MVLVSEQRRREMNQDARDYIKGIADARRETVKIMDESFGSGKWDMDDLNGVWEAYIQACLTSAVEPNFTASLAPIGDTK